MYSLDIFERFNIEVKWSTIYWGITNSYLDMKAISAYVTKYLLLNPDIIIPELLELAWEKDDRNEIVELLESLEKREPKTYKLKDKIDYHKWIYCILNNLVYTEPNKTVLLDKVEIIYADFNYPKGLAGAVRYMPTHNKINPNNHDIRDLENNMVEHLKSFLINERKLIHAPE